MNEHDRPDADGANAHESTSVPSPVTKRPRDAARTRQDILNAAALRFAARGYAHVTLKEIAHDVGITPALVVRYFGGKRELFEAVASTHVMEFPPLVEGDVTVQMAARARGLLDYFEDKSASSVGVALLRSLDLDEGELFRSEVERRIVLPWSSEITGPDAEIRLRLVAGLLLGVGMFSLGALTDPDREPLSRADADRLVHYMSQMLAVCADT